MLYFYDHGANRERNLKYACKPKQAYIFSNTNLIKFMTNSATNSLIKLVFLCKS